MLLVYENDGEDPLSTFHLLSTPYYFTFKATRSTT